MQLYNYLLIPLAFSLVLSGCAKDEESRGEASSGSGQLSQACTVKKIFNGESCPEAIGPVVMLVVADSKGRAQASCTGSFITNRHVLTAAHCMPAVGQTMYAITSKKINVSKVSGVKVKAFNQHPRYASSRSLAFYDVAVATLESVTSAATLPILAREKVKPGQGAYLFGFGLEENQQLSIQNGKSALAPEAARVTVVEASDTTIVFGDKKRGACPGDSGGPAVVSSSRGVSAIVGVTSGGLSSDCRPATLSASEFAEIAGGGLSPEQIQQIKEQFPDGIPQDFYASLQSDAVTNFIARIAPGVSVL